jgi:hypothetical protein
MTSNIQNIDYQSINNIIDKITSVVYDALPHPVFKIHSILKMAKTFGILALVTLLIGLIFVIKSYYDDKDKTVVTITEYENNKKKIKKKIILNENLEKKCTQFFDKDKESLKYIRCNSKFNFNWIKNLAITLLISLFWIMLIMPLADFDYYKKRYFANPVHNVVVDYFLRLFYPLKWGEIWDNQKYDNLRKSIFTKSMYGSKDN